MANLEHQADVRPAIGPSVLLGVALGGWALLQRRTRAERFTGHLPRAYTLQPVDLANDMREAPAAGRDLAATQVVPSTGWGLLRHLYDELNADRVLAVAAGVTFYALLALFPAIVALISVYGLFADASTIGKHVYELAGMLPDGAVNVVGEQITRIVSKGASALSYAFALGLVVALWSANAGMKALFDALNVIYKEPERRTFLQLNALSLLFTVGAQVVAVVVLSGVVGVPIVLNLVGLGGDEGIIVDVTRWPAMFAFVTLALMVIYRFGPSRERPPVRRLFWGAAFAAFAWIVASMLFSWYVSRFGSYNETYGSLGAVIGFMTWIWISTIIVLLGGELNKALEHRALQRRTGPAGATRG